MGAVLAGKFSDRPLPGEIRNVLVRKNYIEALQDIPAAYLLSYIVTWYLPIQPWDGVKSLVTRDGRKWIVKTIKEWAAETGLTFDQTRRAIKYLKGNYFIETEVHLVNDVVSLHIRLIFDPEKFQ